MHTHKKIHWSLYPFSEENPAVLLLSFIVLSKQFLLRQNPCWCKGWELGGWTLTQETIHSLQSRGTPQHIPKQGCCKRGSTHPALMADHAFALHLFSLVLSTFSYFLDPFADPPPPHLHCLLLLCLLFMLVYASLSVQIHIFNQAKSQYTHSSLYTKYTLSPAVWLLGSSQVKSSSRHPVSMAIPLH